MGEWYLKAAPCPGREEMIRKCGIREGKQYADSRESPSGVREPRVCSIEERERIRKEREREPEYIREAEVGRRKEKESRAGGAGRIGSGNAIDGSAINGSTINGASKKGKQNARGGKADQTGRVMIRNFLIRELIHEEGRQDPEGFFKQFLSLVRQELLKPAKKVIKLLLIFVLAVLLVSAALLFLVLFLVSILASPLSWFMGIYEADGELRHEPQYIKNVVQEMYADFYGQIDTFLDAAPGNEVWYAYGQRFLAEEMTAVYLARLVTTEGYRAEWDGKYPAYLLVDTAEERELIEQVFGQFYYYTVDDIKKSVTGASGEEEVTDAERMMVYCPDMERWKEMHLEELTEEGQRFLEVLLKQAELFAGEGGSGAIFGGDSVPITDLTIPEDVDEKLLYLAGFLKAEAGNQPYIGKTAVCYVILNRAGGASGDIKGVLTAPYQFSCYIPFHTVEQYLLSYAEMTEAEREQDACWQAAAAVYYGREANPIGDMKYYCNPKYCSVGEDEQWRRIRAKNTDDEIIIIGDHVFCKNCW